MEKIWIITFDQTEDFIAIPNAPLAFRNEAVARREFQKIKDQVKEEYAEDIANDVFGYNEEDDWFELYEYYSYAENHSLITLHYVELSDEEV